MKGRDLSYLVLLAGFIKPQVTSQRWWPRYRGGLCHQDCVQNLNFPGALCSVEEMEVA